MFRKLLASIGAVPAVHQVGLPLSRYCQQCMTTIGKGSGKLLFGQNSSEKMRKIFTNVGMKLNMMGILFTEQCNRVAALRLKRAYQILTLYQRIYGEQVLMQKIKSNVRNRSRPLLALLSAVIFKWEEEHVSDEELNKCCEEIEEVHKLVELSYKQNKAIEAETKSSEIYAWEQLVDKHDFKIWRKYLPDSDLYQYRVYGHFTDIPPRAFYNTQVDVDYWKDWDKNTIEVSIIDKDDQTQSEVVHWIYKFPYPMYARDYVYVRRYKADPKTGTMVITNRATEHPSCPVNNDYVRVATYTSQMVIKPHTTFDENGFDYVMTYCDDPKVNFPPMCYNWMASTGVHEFLEKVHRAARKKNERINETSTTRIDSRSDIYPNMAHH